MSLPTYIQDHKGDAVRAYFHLLTIATTTPAYLTDCDAPITHNGHTFQPAQGLLVSAVRSNDQTILEADIEIGNGDTTYGVLVSSFVGAAGGNDRAPVVTIQEAWVDMVYTYPPAVIGEGTPDVAVYTVCQGRVESPEWDIQAVKFKVVNGSDSETRKLPGRFYTTVCSYRVFTGPECGYSGSYTTCNRSWDDCTVRGNTARFGGFRAIPAAGLHFWYNGKEYVLPGSDA